MQLLSPAPNSLPPPRFSWPMRLFLTILLTHIVLHSVITLAPYRDWMEDKGMPRYPERLPTWPEIQDATEPGKTSRQIWASLDSAWDYFKPWPSPKMRAKLDGWQDYSMFALSWVSSRLDFFESLVGTPQRWTMFSPNASKQAVVVRIRLVFADRSHEVVRLTADPADLTHYGHWFEEKVLDAELKVPSDFDSRLGYCNYLAHQHPANRAGSPLETIYIYKVKYRYPGPDEDVIAVLKAQNGPPDWDKDGPNWSYDVATRKIRKLTDTERKQMPRWTSP